MSEPFDSNFVIHLTKKQHDLVAQFAVQSGRSMEDALYLLLDASIYMLHCQAVREENAKLAADFVCVCGEPLRGRDCNCAFAALPDEGGAA